MKVEQFKQLYNQLMEDDIVLQNRFVNNLLAGTAITAGTILGLGKLSQIDTKKYQVSQNHIQQKYQIPEQPTVEIPNNIKNIPQEPEIYQNNWINNITMPFVIYWEGKITNSFGQHVVYDDDVNKTIKRRWNGKGGQAGIDAFIKSCVGKPTIGYGETDEDLVRRGIISDSEAKELLLLKLNNIDKYLSETYQYYNIMNPNQKTAFISFSYNLGKYFIQNETVKLKENLKNGNLNKACYQMHDCDNVTQKGKKVKVKGLTRRRQAEMKLFKTPYNK